MLIDAERRKALLWRSVVSIVILFGLLIFMILWILLGSADASDSVNTAVILIAVLAAVGALVTIWVTWSISFPSAVPEQIQYRRGRKIKALTSAVCLTVWALFGIIWTIFLAKDYSFFQNLGVFLAATVLIMGIGWVASEAGRY